MKGATRRRAREHNDRAWLAWHIARLNAYAPPKSDKFIKLKNLLHTDDNVPRYRPKQSWQAQLEITRGIMAARVKR